jgi:hypothetical protein
LSMNFTNSARRLAPSTWISPMVAYVFNAAPWWRPERHIVLQVWDQHRNVFSALVNDDNSRKKPYVQQSIQSTHRQFMHHPDFTINKT